MKVAIAGETSGQMREAFRALGHDAYSFDYYPAVGLAHNHVMGDFFETLPPLGPWDLVVAHPTCTYLTCSAEWAYKDPDFDRYPGVGYHQRLRPGTLFGAERRAARERALADFRRILAWAKDGTAERLAIENPIGAASKAIRKPDQIIQPHQFGDDASKATCWWLENLPPLVIDPTAQHPGRAIEYPPGSGKMVRRWANQTDGGQNRVTPSEERWAERSDTYPGVAKACAVQWGSAAGRWPATDLFQQGAVR